MHMRNSNSGVSIENKYEQIVNIVLLISFALLLIALGISLLRLIKGPTISDRIVAMDLISSITPF